MAALFNSLLLLPIWFLVKFLVDNNYLSNVSAATTNIGFFRTPAVSQKRTLSDQDFQLLGQLTEDEKLHFNQTLQRILVPRVSDTPSHANVRLFIEGYLKDLGWQIENDEFIAKTPQGRKTFNNIIATLNPNACKRVVLACHYDAKYFPDFEFLAATDSAVPCTMMLELVRLLDSQLKTRHSSQNEVSLQLIFFDGEEAFKQWSFTDSLYGSRHLAGKMSTQLLSSGTCLGRNMESELDRIQVLILLDLIGEASPQFCSHSPVTRALFDKLTQIENKLNRRKLMETRRLSGTKYFPKRCFYNSRIEDDHVPFEDRGVPVLHIIATPFPQNWHIQSDDGSNLHYPTIYNLIKVFRLFLVEYFNL